MFEKMGGEKRRKVPKGSSEGGTCDLIGGMNKPSYDSLYCQLRRANKLDALMCFRETSAFFNPSAWDALSGLGLFSFLTQGVALGWGYRTPLGLVGGGDLTLKILCKCGEKFFTFIYLWWGLLHKTTAGWGVW